MKNTYRAIVFVLAGLYLGSFFIRSQRVKRACFKGMIISKYGDGFCHGTIVVRSGSGNDTLFNINSCDPGKSSLWANSEIGDTINKLKGEATITLMGSNKQLIFDYPSKPFPF